MEYAIKNYEWDLTQEEKDKAKFIITYASETNIKVSETGINHSMSSQVWAFEQFKNTFYREVGLRLNIQHAGSWYGSESYTFALSHDGTKLLGYRVEPVG